MSVRPARFADIPRLTDLMIELHARSRYRRYALQTDDFKKLCVETIRRHGPFASLFVSVGGEEVTGFLIGLTEEIYGLLRERYATDLFFYVTPRSPARHCLELFTAYLAWASEAPRVIEVRNGAVDAVEGMDPEKTAAIYRRFGLRREGVIYRKELVA